MSHLVRFAELPPMALTDIETACARDPGLEWAILRYVDAAVAREREAAACQLELRIQKVGREETLGALATAICNVETLNCAATVRARGRHG
jgi:hypothetical protein